MPIPITLPSVGGDANAWGTELNTALTALANAFDQAPVVIYESGGVYPARSTATNSSTRMVIWYGVDQPTIGGSGAINDVDEWHRKA